MAARPDLETRAPNGKGKCRYAMGNSGLRVSEAALGTMTFGDELGWGSAKDEAKKIYDAFHEAGGNFIDTANFYKSMNLIFSVR